MADLELLHESVRRWVRDTPRAPAIEVPWGLVWSYRDLGEWADAFAEQVVACTNPEDVVAVEGPRGFFVVAAMLGVLSTSRRLLTLDPKLPPLRRQYMLDTARAQLLLNPASWELPPRSGVTPKAIVGNAAYVFFTSGSTGTPKGIVGTQWGLAHFLDWQRREFRIGPRDRAAQLTGLSFDVVLRDMFLVLSSGGTLCIPPSELTPERTLPWLAKENVTVLHTVPSLMSRWLGEARFQELPALRHAFFAGEPLYESLARSFAAITPAEIVNLYGPTETTLAKCFHRVRGHITWGIQPIGRPLPDTEILVMDASLRPCPVGTLGQLAIATPFRTLGYLNDAEANARAWVAHPSGGEPMYLTGDLGLRREDGVLEIRGRLDSQLKIRGVRVEPAEVEAVLAKHPSIREVAVLGCSLDGEPELVAFIVPRSVPDASLTVIVAGDLRRFARRFLPSPMVPTRFELLTELPLNANGKTDRRELARRDGLSHAGGRDPLNR